MEQVAVTLKNIKTGKRKFREVDEALSICKEMFDAGYTFAKQEDTKR